MSAICLFGALCSVNQDYFSSNIDFASFDESIIDDFSTVESNPTYFTYSENSNQSPCPSVFRYFQSSGAWYGKVTLENYESQKDIKLRVEMTISRILQGVSINFKTSNMTSRKLNLILSKQKNSGDVDLTNVQGASNNQPLIYLVKFPTQNPIPKIKGIYYNEQRICSGPGGLVWSNAIFRIMINLCL